MSRSKETGNEAFSDRERERYQRHLQLPGFAAAGQATLRRSHALVVGLGGLGCPAALYLAAAGVGRLTLVDGDTVSLSNLQRQILFTEDDLGANKAQAAARHLAARNSDISVTATASPLDVDNAPALLESADIVLDCTDNFHTRYLVNDVCHYLDKPWVYASVLGFAGQLALFRKAGGCFRCLFPELGETPDCNQAGVLGAVPGILGTQQALMAIRFLSGLHDNQARLHSFDGLGMQLRSINLTVSPECPLCSGRQTFHDRGADYAAQCAPEPAGYTLAAADFTRFVDEWQPLLVDVRSAAEHSAGNLGGHNIPLEHLTVEIDLVADDDRPIVLYCQSGIRSAGAVQVLLDKGLENVLSLAGGVEGQAR